MRTLSALVGALLTSAACSSAADPAELGEGDPGILRLLDGAAAGAGSGSLPFVPVDPDAGAGPDAAGEDGGCLDVCDAAADAPAPAEDAGTCSAPCDPD